MTKYCAQCKAGEVWYEADVKVTGFRLRYDGRRVPYNANICDDHFTLLTEDGAQLRVVEYISEQARQDRVLELLRQYTGYTTIEQFLASNPTLRPGTFSGADFLRSYYRERTGRVAAR